MSTLKLRHVAIDTYRENVAYLHPGCPVYRRVPGGFRVRHPGHPRERRL